MQRDPTRDPHYLHAARAIEPLVSPPVDQPRALCWLDAETLFVAARDGGIHRVEPAFGTRFLLRAAPDPALVATGHGKLAVLTRSGLLQVWSIADAALVWQVKTGLVAGLHLQPWADGFAVVGEDGLDRRVLIHEAEGRRIARARIPPRTALGTNRDGYLLLARSTESGVTVRDFGRPLPTEPATNHTLRFAPGQALLGIAPAGVTVWHPPYEGPVTVKLFDVVNAALSPDGTLVAMGTREGAVSIGGARPGGQRVNPGRVEGHEGPVLGLAFSPRGRWLASLASRCWVWSY